jgi:hypothetical protein
MSGASGIATVVEAAALAALAARGVAEADRKRIAKATADRCAGLPQFRPPVIQSAPVTVIGRKARKHFIDQQAAKFLSEVGAYIDQVIGYCVEQLVEIEIERLTRAAETEAA